MQEALTRSRRLASICTGAYFLAHAGLLDGRRATTHWIVARDIQTRFPKIKMEEDRIFIIDGSVWTSAGMTAGVDLALAMVEKDHGADLARAVAKKLVVYHRRAGGQSQFSALLEMEPKIGPDSKRSRLCQTQSAHAAVGGTARRSRAFEPPAIQPRLPLGDGSVAGQGGGEPARRGGPADDGGRGGTRSTWWRRKPALPTANACGAPFCGLSGNRRRRSGGTRSGNMPLEVGISSLWCRDRCQAACGANSSISSSNPFSDRLPIEMLS